MVAKILFLLSGIFIQEFVLLNALIVATHHGLYVASVVFILFVVATAIDIGIGFYIGSYLRRKTSQTRFSRYIQRKSEQFSFKKENPKRWLTLLVLGNISFCYINAAVAAYLELPFWESQAYNFFGNILSYTLLWYAVGSISDVFQHNYFVEGGVILLIILIAVLLQKVSARRI
jgi:membrane protein DedA with SNARE-associated domain